jgi:hypothetical protein
MLWRTLKILNTLTVLLRVLNNLKRRRLGRLLWWVVSSRRLTRLGGRLRYMRGRAQIHFARLAVAAEKNAALVKLF